MLRYIDKPLEEMTIEELQTEKRVHVWLAKSLERIQAILMFNAEHRNSPNYEEELAQLKADYFDEVIDDEEFIKSRNEVRRIQSVKKWHYTNAQQKAEYALMIAKYHRGFVAEIDERIEELKFPPPPPKERKLPKTYGYDPRKNISKYNYPRDDWGETRKNHNKHRAKKGK